VLGSAGCTGMSNTALPLPAPPTRPSHSFQVQLGLLALSFFLSGHPCSILGGPWQLGRCTQSTLALQLQLSIPTLGSLVPKHKAGTI
jgi:hypothetical protein